MSDKNAKVVEVRSANVLQDDKIISAEAIKMFKAGLDALSPAANGDSFLKQLFPSGKKIGIKVNSLAGPRMSTSPELVYAFADVLYNSGHPKNDIIIWDRSERELKRAGYTISARGLGYLCIATDTTGVGFANNLYSHKSIGSMVSKIQAEMIDLSVNFPVLKDHSLAGLSGCLKNNYGMIHNPNKYHPNSCDPYQADLYSLDIISDKEKLAIFDAIYVQYNGGPGYIDYWTEAYRAILLSTDAIALDTIGIQIIDKLRTQNGFNPLKESGREPIGVKTAGKNGLGCAEPDKIEWLIIEV